MTTDEIISLGVLFLGIAMLLTAWANIPAQPELYIAGSVLIGSWLIRRSIGNSNKS